MNDYFKKEKIAGILEVLLKTIVVRKNTSSF